MNTKRGFFVLDRMLLERLSLEELEVIFNGFIPLYIDNNAMADTMTYHGIHKDFKTTGFGMTIPQYEAVVTKYDNILTRKWNIVE